MSADVEANPMDLACATPSPNIMKTVEICATRLVDEGKKTNIQSDISDVEKSDILPTISGLDTLKCLNCKKYQRQQRELSSAFPILALEYRIDSFML